MLLLAAAKEGIDRWCETDVNACWPCQVEMGGAFEAELYGSNSLIVLSAPHVSSFLSLVHAIPFTIFSCACACHISCRLVRFQTLMIPSPLPDAKCSSLHMGVRCDLEIYNKFTHDSGSLAKLYTPSTWPGSKLARNGWANMRSSFVALRALVYSLARSKGCRLGSRLRVCLATFDPGACVDAADLLRALIFILSIKVLRSRLRFAAVAREILVRAGANADVLPGRKNKRAAAHPHFGI